MTNFLPGQGDPNFNWGGGLASTSVIDDALQQAQDDETESQHTAALGFFSQQFSPYINQQYPQQLATGTAEAGGYSAPAAPPPDIQPIRPVYTGPFGAITPQGLGVGIPKPFVGQEANAEASAVPSNAQGQELYGPAATYSHIPGYAPSAYAPNDIAQAIQQGEGKQAEQVFNQLTPGLPAEGGLIRNLLPFVLGTTGGKAAEMVGANPLEQKIAQIGSMFLPGAAESGFRAIRGSGELPVARMAPDYDVFRGSGRAEKGSVYNEFGSGEPIFKDATYYAFDPKVAAEYGPNVEASKVGIEKPLVLKNDEQYRALSRQAGMEYPNPFGMEPAAQAAEFQKLRDFVTAQGHDGIVVQMDQYGDNAKLLRNLFGDDQVIDFKSSAKSASVPANDLAARQAAIPGAEQMSAGQPGIYYGQGAPPVAEQQANLARGGKPFEAGMDPAEWEYQNNVANNPPAEEPLNAFKRPQYDIDASGTPVKLPESGGPGKPPIEPPPAPPSAGPEPTPENPHGMYVTPEGLAAAEAARNASLAVEGSPTQGFKDFLAERKGSQNGTTPLETPPVDRGPRDELGRPVINQGKGNGIGGKPPIDTGTAGGEEVPPGDTSDRWKEAPKLPAGSIGQNLLDLSRAPIGFKVLAHDTLLKQDGPSIILSPKAVLESKKASFRAIRSPKEAQAVMNEVQQMPWMNSKNNPLDFNPNRLRQSKFGIGVESEARESEAQLMGGTSATARAFQSFPFMQANERFYAVGKNVERAYQSNVLLQNLYDHGLETARKGTMMDAERGAVSSPVSPSGRTLGVIADSGPDSMHPKFLSDAEKEWYQRQVIAGAGRFTSWMTPKSDEVAYQRGMQQFKAMQDVLNHRTQYGSWRQGWAPLFSTRAFSGRIQMLADPFVQPGSIFSNSARQEAIKSVMAQASFSGAQLGLASALGAKIGFGSSKFGYGLPTATWTGPDGSKHSYNPWAGISGPTSAVIKTAQFQGQPDKQLAAWVDLLNSNLSPTFSLGKEVATGTNWQGKTFGGTEKQTGSNPVQWGATALHNLGVIGQRKDTYVQLAAPIWLESALNLLKHDPAWMAAIETLPATEASGINVTGKAAVQQGNKPLLPRSGAESSGSNKPLLPRSGGATSTPVPGGGSTNKPLLPRSNTPQATPTRTQQPLLPRSGSTPVPSRTPYRNRPLNPLQQ